MSRKKQKGNKRMSYAEIQKDFYEIGQKVIEEEIGIGLTSSASMLAKIR